MAMNELDKCIKNGSQVLDHHEFVQRISTKAHIQRARLNYWGDDAEAARKDANRAIEIASRYSQRHAMNDVAWFLVTGPTELLDPERAIPLAEQAVEQWTKSRRTPLFTLGFAYYLAQQYKEAIETFEVIHRSWPHEKSRVHFLLAAAYWQVGERDVARKWYEQGMEQGVRMFRSPASKLMGQKEDTDAEEHQSQSE